MKTRPTVSAIVPTFNLKKILAECLQSIMKQDYPILEIIVVDNASSDGTSDMIRKKFPQVKLITNKKNLGVTGGVNTGLKVARGDYFWMVDHDNIFEPDMLSTMIALGESDKKIGVVVPKIFYWEPKDIIWAAGAGQNILTGENIFRGGKDVGQFDQVEAVDVAVANFLIKKAVIKKVGLYDDIFFISYEDTDISFRIRRAGYKIMYTPKAVCYHKIPLLDAKTAKKRWLARSYWAARNKIIFMRKHSRFFPLFVLLYPIWFGGYTYQAIRHKDLSALINFYKGIAAGFKWAFFDYEA